MPLLLMLVTAHAAEIDVFPPRVHDTWFVGTKTGSLVAFEDHESFSHFGGGAFVEYLAGEHFETEIAIQALTAHEGTLLPIDIIPKLAYHVSETLEPYGGAGACVVLPVATDHHEPLRYGVAMVAGSNIWLAPHLGVYAEPNVNLLWGGEHMTPEVGGVTGLIYGW